MSLKAALEGKALQPSPIEKQRARNGYYPSYTVMPRIVRDWATNNDCHQTKNGVRTFLAGPLVIEQAVRANLQRQNKKRRRR